MAREGISFLVCPDIELIKARIGEMLASTGETWEKRVYWADEELPSDFWQDLTAVSLLGGKKAVILRRVESLKADGLKQLSPVLAGANSSAWPILCVESAWDRGKPKIPAILSKQKFWKAAAERGWVWQQAGLTDQTLPGFVKNWEQKKGMRIDPRIFQELCRLLPTDASALANELDKLELAAGESRSVGREHLELVAPSGEIDFWQMLSHLQEGRIPPDVWKEVLKERSSSDSLLFPLSASLIRECRQLWQILHGEPVRLPGWLQQKKEQAARRIGAKRLAGIWNLAFEADLSIKSGEKSETQALEALVAGLHDLFRPKGRPGPRPRM